MGIHRIQKGLDLPIRGAPEQVLPPAPPITRVGLMGDDPERLRQAAAFIERAGQ